MAELTQLESKLGEVLGLAMAAQEAGKKIAKLVAEDDADIAQTLQRMVEEAKETQERSEAVAGEIDGKKTAILEKGRETKKKAAEMMDTYLDEEADGLDGLEFLTMAEAGELGHWRILGTMSEKAGDARLQELAQAIIPIQERHFSETMEGSIKLACEEDPNETE
jgi:hypothetical protein